MWPPKHPDVVPDMSNTPEMIKNYLKILARKLSAIASRLEARSY